MNLRKLQIEDLSFLLEVRNHITTRSNLANDSEFTLDDCKKWFIETKPIWYIIEVNNNPVGYLRTNNNEIGCDIHPNFRRNGYARQAYKLYLANRDYATLWVFSDNHIKQLYLSLGFRYTGNKTTIRNREYIEMEYKSNL